MKSAIGVAVTTYNRTALLKECLTNLVANTVGARLLVSDDSVDPAVVAANKAVCEEAGVEYHNNGRNRGIARNKNNCLRLLQDCSYIFLLDDDAYPVHKNWVFEYVAASVKTGIQHFTYNPWNTYCNSAFDSQRMLTEVNGVKLTTAYMSSGVLLFLTRDVLQTVGGMNEAFGRWGHEHVEHSYRIHNFGFTGGLGPFVSLAGDERLFFAHDFFTPSFHGSRGVHAGEEYAERERIAAQYRPLLEENKHKRLFRDFKGRAVERIPKVIHQIWIGDQRLRPAKLMQTWKDAHPDWEYRFWDDKAIADLKLLNKERYNLAPEYAGKADIARYEILQRFGGWYIDADTVCLRPIPDALTSGGLVVMPEAEGHPLLANSYIGAEPSSRYMTEMVRRIATTPLDRVRGESAWKVTGPLLYTEVVRELEGDDLVRIPSHLFVPEHHSSPKLAREQTSDVEALRSTYPKSFAYQFWGSTRKSYGKPETAKPAAPASAPQPIQAPYRAPVRLQPLAADATVSIIVPWHPTGCAHRDAAWAHLSEKWRETAPDWELVVVDSGGDSGSTAFRKAAAFRDAGFKAKGDILIFADADCWADGVFQAVKELRDGAAWCEPATTLVRLEEGPTQEFLAGRVPVESADLNPRGKSPGGGLIAMRRSVFAACPPDPRFEGWGGEDCAWAAALAGLYGDAAYISGPLWHLYHPRDYVPDHGNSRNVENTARFERYLKATGSALETASLVLEAQRAEPAAACPVIVSMTTIPKREGMLLPVLKALAAQTYRPDEVRLYHSSEWSPAVPTSVDGLRVQLCPVQDRGPITKLSAVADPAVPKDALVVTADDDIEHAPTWLETLLKGAMRHPEDVVGCSGFLLRDLLKQGQIPNGRTEGYCDIIEGFAGVVYRKRFFAEDVFDIPEWVRHEDDAWISAYLARRQVQRRVVSTPLILKDHGRDSGLHTRPEREAQLLAMAPRLFAGTKMQAWRPAW